MARYILLENKIPTGVTATSKKKIDTWCEKMHQRGVEWRAGYMLKLDGYAPVYDWVHNKDRTKHVKCG